MWVLARSRQQPPRRPPAAPLAGAGCLALLTLGLLAAPAGAQWVDISEQELLPTTIGTSDIELRGRYVREMRDDLGGIALQFNGGFRLTFGRRTLSATNAVVWVRTRTTETPPVRQYLDLTVYLSENAELVEPGGTITQDRVLYVSNLLTYGRLVRYSDAHIVDDLTRLPLYQQAVAVRTLVEQSNEPPAPALGPGVVRPRELVALQPPRPPTVIRYRLARVEPSQTPEGETVLVATGGVYFARSGGADSPMLEVRADRAVIFLGSPTDEAGGLTGTDVSGDVTPAAAGDAPTAPPPPPPADDPAGEDWRGALQNRLRAVYLEGDVALSLGTNFVRTERLYYDFELERALILDAVFRAELPERGIPLYLRAARIRQHSGRRFSALDARVTTSEFHTPHYHVGAERLELTDRTPRDNTGRATGNPAGTFTLLNATYNIEGTPVAWWPYASGDFETGEQVLRSFTAGYSSEFGARVKTRWYLFNLLGVARPPGYDATLRTDYLSRRGPGIGIDSDYERENHFGLFRSYYIHDDGEDDLGPLRKAENTPDTKERGRLLWRHRQFLPNDWELTLEGAWISDPNFLETYERSEFWEGKEQETAIYLRKQLGETESITLLANWRLLDFLTQTEHLPELTYRRLGDTFLSPVVLYHESRVGAVRYRVDERELFEYSRWRPDRSSDLTFRADVRQEAELPLKLGPVNLVPFGTVRGSHWDGQPIDDGSLWRGFGLYGLRGTTAMYRVYDDVHSALLDISRLRHIVQPHVTVWNAHSNVRSDRITPFDEGIENIDPFYGTALGVRQVWQTKRGAGDQARTVDLLTVNIEAGFFGDVQPDELSTGWVNPIRPENSRTRNYAALEAVYRLSDTTSLLYDNNFDLNDGRFDRHNVSIAVERLPRLAYLFGYRYGGDINYDMLGGGFNYRLNEKHIVAVRAWYDLHENKLGEVAVSYVRKLPRWYFAVNFEWDEVFDDVSVTISMWPEGIPEWSLGSRRFTGLGTTTGIRP
jgi:hypothetical protein